jgi:hypothetical protein
MFIYRTREVETIVDHVVVCTVLSDITCWHAIHVGNGNKTEIHLAHINIHGKILNCEGSEWIVYNHCSGYSG